MANPVHGWLFRPLFVFLFLPLVLGARGGDPENMLPTQQPFPHPFYVSVTEINHNAKEQSLEISCKIFADDLEEILRRTYKQPIDFANAAAHAQTEKLVQDYLGRRLALRADGKPVGLRFLGFEKDSESAWCYFEAVGLPVVKKLEVQNSILQDFTPQQINILHVTVNGLRKSFKLDFPAKEASFAF